MNVARIICGCVAGFCGYWFTRAAGIPHPQALWLLGLIVSIFGAIELAAAEKREP
jgi:uncharacterized membrane protein YeaQ/YmgE (transglycosylase-associated protein family)